MSPTKPVGEKPPNPNGRRGNTDAQVVSPAPNQDVRGPGGTPGDDGAPATGTAATELGKTQGAASSSSSKMAKTNVRLDQRFKRNVLEVRIKHSNSESFRFRKINKKYA